MISYIWVWLSFTTFTMKKLRPRCYPKESATMKEEDETTKKWTPIASIRAIEMTKVRENIIYPIKIALS